MCSLRRSPPMIKGGNRGDKGCPRHRIWHNRGVTKHESPVSRFNSIQQFVSTSVSQERVKSEIASGSSRSRDQSSKYGFQVQQPSHFSGNRGGSLRNQVTIRVAFPTDNQFNVLVNHVEGSSTQVALYTYARVAHEGRNSPVAAVGDGGTKEKATFVTEPVAIRHDMVVTAVSNRSPSQGVIDEAVHSVTKPGVPGARSVQLQAEHVVAGRFSSPRVGQEASQRNTQKTNSVDVCARIIAHVGSQHAGIRHSTLYPCIPLVSCDRSCRWNRHRLVVPCIVRKVNARGLGVHASRTQDGRIWRGKHVCWDNAE